MTKKKRGNPQLDVHRNTDLTAALKAKSEKALAYSIDVVDVVLRELEIEFRNHNLSICNDLRSTILNLGITKAQLVRSLNANRAVAPKRLWNCRNTCTDSCSGVCKKGHSLAVTQEGLTRALRYALEHAEKVSTALQNRFKFSPARNSERVLHARDTGTILEALLHSQ